MKDFRLAHYKSAKRKTRSLETWLQMENILIENKGKLFIATKDKKIELFVLWRVWKTCFWMVSNEIIKSMKLNIQ